MRIVYVGDNRNRGNFGCRGTSTALSQLISSEHQIVGRISGRYTNHDTGELVCKKGLKISKYEKYAKIKNWDYLRKAIYFFHRYRARGGKYLLGKYDFASLDFDDAIDNLIACLPANPYLKEFDLRQYDFDALVVNGEGSFIFATPAWRESVIEAMEMYWAKKLGKKVYYLNGMLSDDPHSAHNSNTIDSMKPIFEMCDAVCVREYESYNYVKKYFPNINAQVFPDALFTWYDIVNDDHKVLNGKYYIPHVGECDEAYYSFDFEKPYICVSGSSSIMGLCHGDISVAVESYVNLVKRIKSHFNLNVYLVEVCEGDFFLNEVSRITECPIINMETPLVASAKILSNAVIYISGRYHPSILAALGGTPSVYMTSNSHKTRSIQQLLEYDEIIEFPVIPNESEINDIISYADKLVNRADEERTRLKNRAKYLSELAQGLKKVLNE